MHPPSAATQESGPVFDFAAQLGRFALNTTFQCLNSKEQSLCKSNYLSFDARIGRRKRNVAASLSLGGRGSLRIITIWNEFNRAVRFHCERIPLGFASIRVSSGDGNGNGDGSNGANVLRDDGCGVSVDEGLPLNGVEAESPKKVLILMSDTGGGHRASAEAIKAAFYEEFGDDYQEADYVNVPLLPMAMRLFVPSCLRRLIIMQK